MYINQIGHFHFCKNRTFLNWLDIINKGDGTFENKVDYPGGKGPHSVFCADLDGDSYLDLAVANFYDSSISVFKNNGAGTFPTRDDYLAGQRPLSIFCSDLDADSDLDIAMTNAWSNTVSIFKNNGDGTFQTKVDYSMGGLPSSIFCADIDGDFDLDMVASNAGSNTVSVLKNNGDGTFGDRIDYATGAWPYSLYCADLDKDGDLDLAAADEHSNAISILLNNNDGTFQNKVDYVAGTNPRSIFCADLDLDSSLDVVVVNGLSKNISLFRNNGDGTFRAKTDYAVGNEPWSVFSADLDNDGTFDLAVTNSRDDNVSILINRAKNFVIMPDTCVKLGEFILIPVGVSDVTGQGVYSAEITLSFDKSILKATDATLLGTIAEGRLMFFSKYDDSIRIAISGTVPLAGSGPLVYVGFNVLSLPKDSTIIHFDRMRFNEGIPPVTTRDAIIKPCEVFQISGVIRYCLNNNPVDAALVKITSGKTDSVLTDASGGYSFLNLTGGLDYTVTPDKTDDASGSITAYDASLVLRYVVHLINFSSCQKLSADVTGNCEVSAYDASYILRHVVGQITQFPIGKDWRFFPATFVLDANPCLGIPDSIFYAALLNNNFNQDYIGILYGDVSGNWTSKVVIAVIPKQISVLPKITAKEFIVKPGEEFTLPIKFADLDEIYSAEFSLGYNADWLEAKAVTQSEFTSGFMLEQKISNGQIKIALAGAKPVTGTGSIVGITFKVSDKAKIDDRAEIKLQNLRLNESDLMEPNLAYVISIGAQVPKEFSLSQNHPNPFNPMTSIEYTIPERSYVLLEIYNLIGQNVITLVNEKKEAGIHQAIWDGKDKDGNRVSSGVYFYQISTENFTQTKKMLMIK